MDVQTKKTVKVEFLQVEMPSEKDNSCSACDTIQSKLVSAIKEVQILFDKLDCEILFKQTTIKTVEEAERAHISASPTIRVGNLDFFPDHTADASEAREWTWGGQIMSEPDKRTLIEVLLKGYFESKKDAGKKILSPYILKHLNENESIKSSSCCH
ncbi:hypothetical protein ACFSKL_15970 [Belliella marina]|uniref:Uncharacterized protein n=1 Tax=Belliella marina TaxID=1644146 RepID=A0ABW4VRB2_9BACT